MIRAASIVYRFVYCVILALILAILLQGVPFDSFKPNPKPLLLWAYVIVVVLTGVVAVMFRRLSRAFVWSELAIFCALFTWHSWFGPGGFLIQTEVHSFDPIAVMAERARFNHYAAISYAVMMVWFLSLPIIRQLAGKIVRDDSSRRVMPAMNSATKPSRRDMQKVRGQLLD
jgi:hypothetical protein